MKVCVIGLGGCGINQVSAILRQLNAENIEMPDVEFLMIDGSDSNMLDKQELMDHFWLVPGVDGAGKVRKNGAQAYIDYIKANVAKIPQATLYILNYSLSGGSGSVLGPTLNTELMQRGALTINVALATDNSAKDVENTRNTLAGLANTVRALQRPVHCCIEDSSSGKPSEVDQMMRNDIIELMRICGERHVGLDSQDVRSFLDYQVHGIAPALTMIERFDSAEAMSELSGAVFTTLSLLTDNDNQRPNVGAMFNTDGICQGDVDTHFVTTTKNMDALSRRITERDEFYKTNAGGLNTRPAFGSEDGDTLVL